MRVHAAVRASLIALSLGLAACATKPVSSTDDPVARVKALQQSLLTLDTHLDTPAILLRDGWSISDEHSVGLDGSDVDLPRMKAGGLDGGFWVIYTRQGPRTPDGFAKARAHALRTAAAIAKMVTDNPNDFERAYAADDAERIAAKGKRVVYMSIENSYPLGTSVDSLKEFYGLGVRLVGPVHFLNNEFGDSATDPKGPEWKGLSPLGKQLVVEANRLGMILDASHASDDVLRQLIELSKTPVLLSHSGVKAVFNHPRNIDDDLLKALAASGGVIQMNALSAYLVDTPKNPARETALAAMYAKYDLESLTAAQGEALTKERAAIDATYPVPQATFEDFMAQMLHALKVVGPDHVGVGADWDGGGGVTGMEDVSMVWKISDRLLKAGYTEDGLRKIWGGNVLRLLRAAEAERDREAAGSPGKN
jgi:membrane dipeptidase